MAVDRGEKRGPIQIQIRRRLAVIDHGFQQIDRQGIGRDLPVAHVLSPRIDFTRQPATMTCVSHKQHLGATELELPNEMIELAGKNALLGSECGRLETRQQENILKSVGFGAFDGLRLLGSVPGDGQDDEIVRRGPLNDVADRLKNDVPACAGIEQRCDVTDAHRTQRPLDIAGIGNSAPELAHVLIGIDSDDQAADRAAIRILKTHLIRRGHTGRSHEQDTQDKQAESQGPNGHGTTLVSYWRMNSTRRFRA